MRSRFRASSTLLLALTFASPVGAVCAVTVAAVLGRPSRDVAAEEAARPPEPGRAQAPQTDRPPAPRLLSVEVVPDGPAADARGAGVAVTSRPSVTAPPAISVTRLPPARP